MCLEEGKSITFIKNMFIDLIKKESEGATMKKFLNIMLIITLLVSMCTTTISAAESWLWPIEIKHTFTTYNGHKGIDIAVPAGTPVHASKSGTLYVEDNRCNGSHNIETYARITCTVPGCASKTGKCVYIYHGDGTLSCYMHLSELKYTATTEVKQGDIIGYVGTTGPSTGDHLHFEVAYGSNNSNYWANSRVTDGIANSDTKYIKYIYETHTCPTAPKNDKGEWNYETYKNDNIKILGACKICHKEFDWFTKLERVNGTATLKSSKKNYKVTLYKKPYKDAETINTNNKVLKDIPIIATVKNAYGNEWYAINYEDNKNQVCWTGYINSQTLIDNYDISTSITAETNKYESSNTVTTKHTHNYNYNNGQCYCGFVKSTTKQTNEESSLNISLTQYPYIHTQGKNFGLRGTISSNYDIKKIYGYIKQNGNVIQSSEDTPNSKSVNVKNQNLNDNLIFDSLNPGSYTLEVNAIDSSGNSMRVSKDFTVVGEVKRDESSLSINLEKYPVTINIGNGFGLRGSVTSNYNISVVKGYVIDSSGQTRLSSKDTPNSTNMNIQYARLNNDLVFNNLSAGNYILKIIATDSSGKNVEVTKNFSVISNTLKNDSALSINLEKYPVTLDVGSSYGLRGSITSNYNISTVSGYVTNANGQTVLSSKDRPNSTYMDIRYAHLNNDLIFNNLSAGNYTMKVVAADVSGRTVEASKNFTVKAKAAYVDNSPNGNGVTGTVSIPSSWDNLSIRTGPSTNYEIIGSMNNGVKCTVYLDKTSNGWYYVNYNGIWGYASGKQINLSTSSNTQTKNTRVGTVNIPSNWDNLSIRTGPSTDYQIIGSMNNGVRCTVYPDKANNGWYYVEYNGICGYAAGNRIDLQ